MCKERKDNNYRRASSTLLAPQQQRPFGQIRFFLLVVCMVAVYRLGQSAAKQQTRHRQSEQSHVIFCLILSLFICFCPELCFVAGESCFFLSVQMFTMPMQNRFASSDNSIRYSMRRNHRIRQQPPLDDVANNEFVIRFGNV